MSSPPRVEAGPQSSTVSFGPSGLENTLCSPGLYGLEAVQAAAGLW